MSSTGVAGALEYLSPSHPWYYLFLTGSPKVREKILKYKSFAVAIQVKLAA
jgi:hypothetical protein